MKSKCALTLCGAGVRVQSSVSRSAVFFPRDLLRTYRRFSDNISIFYYNILAVETRTPCRTLIRLSPETGVFIYFPGVTPTSGHRGRSLPRDGRIVFPGTFSRIRHATDT